MQEELDKFWSDSDYSYYMLYLNGERVEEKPTTVCSFLKKVNEKQRENMARVNNALDYTRPAKVKKEVKERMELFSSYDHAMTVI